MWIWMWVSLLGLVYLASAALIAFVVYQDRANAAVARTRRAGQGRDPRASRSPEMVFSTRC